MKWTRWWRPLSSCRRGSLAPQLLLLLVTLCSCCARCWAAAPDKNIFTIRHEKNNVCIQVKDQRIVAGDCQWTKETLWTWVSRKRLFNLGSQLCLGLDTAKTPNSLKMVDCDSELLTLWWLCAEATIMSASQNKLTLSNEIVTANIHATDRWRRSNSSDVICQFPYHDIYTRDGNSYGKPCVFPFLVNNTWHHDCISNEMFTDGEWCSTTSNFDKNRKWGYCLKPEDGCQNTWELDADSGNCYQLNTQAALSWREAYISCQSQNGDLLSIGSASELNYIQGKDGIAETFWIGLNQLDTSAGWQWSDHRPLNFLSWSPEMEASSPLDGSGCVVMNANTGSWTSYPCETSLPYVCKKQVNNTQWEFPGAQNYTETQCEPGWQAHNGFCYLLKSSPASWNDAYQSCNTSHSDLISIHSLADVELVVTELHNETKDQVWTGFINEDIPALFKWSDGSKVVFTYWDQDEPKIPTNSTPNCVAYSGVMGRWRILPCEEKLKYVCMKKGIILNESKSDQHCPSDAEWKRHRDFCYKVDKDAVPFGRVCNLTIANRFEQEFINSLIRKHSTVDRKYFWTGLQDITASGEYTWGSKDGKKEMLTYANWGHFQPEFRGGCVVMSSGQNIGKWEVKDCKTFQAYSICKTYIGPKKEPEREPKVTDPCPPGWYSGSHLACYKFFHKERVLRTRTWEEAERFCEALGGHLPSFGSLEEVSELRTILRDIISDDRWVWVGLNKRNPESQGSWEWSDKKPVSTVVLHPEFKDDYDTRDCAAVKSFRATRRSLWSLYYFEDKEEEFYLKPFYCGAKLEWVCQIPKGSTIKTPKWYKPDEDGIHGPTLNIDGSEFWFVPDKHLSYQEAALYCSNNGSDLASVTSFTALTGILNRIANLSDERQNWWLKFTPRPRHYSPYSVFSHYYERHFRDCWHVSYQTWYRESMLSCSAKLPFICEKYNTSLLETHDPGYKPPQTKCPDQWIPFINKCFRTVPPKDMKFQKAKDYCKTFGGLLPSIKSQAEQDFITSLLPGLPQNIWIGLHFRVHTRENKWADGSQLDYSNFHPLLQGRLRKVQIDLFDEEANNQCGVLLNYPTLPYVGTWNFTSCADTKTVAICEMSSDAVENQTQKVSDVTMKYLNVTYTIILKNLTWHDAQQECLRNGMQLVSITEQYQQAFLAVQTARYDYPLWIGLSSKDDGEHYHWSDNKHISFSRWSEEDEDLVDECVYLDSDAFWKTSDCYSEKPGAVCYIPGNDTEKPEVFETVSCPHKIKNTPWIPFRNSCYTFMITKDRWKRMKADESHHLCRMMNTNASLLTVRDEDENAFIVEQLKSFSGLANWARLGLIYEPDDNVLKWYDNTHLSYNNWRMGRPYIRNNYFIAGVNIDGLWDIKNYTLDWTPYQFNLHSILVCKIEMGPKEDKPPLPKLLPYGNNSYYWIIQKQLSWYEAWKGCKQDGGDLASVHNENEQVLLEDIVKRDGFPLWIGLSNHNESDSSFEWSDGSEFDYKPWEYENSRSPGNCFFLDTKGSWNRLYCTQHVDGAICRNSSTEMKSKQTQSSSSCPKTDGSAQWIHYKDHCYAFDMVFFNFSIYNGDSARKVCKNLDPSATLLTIKDAEENKFVSSHLKEHNFVTGKVWLGMQTTANSLNWLDGTEVKYTNWAKSKLKNENANGKCIVIFSANGTWSQTDCLNTKSRVVCKAPQVSNQIGGAIAVAVLIIVVLLAGVICFLYKRKHLHRSGFSSVRYERGMYEDETDSMFTRDGD